MLPCLFLRVLLLSLLTLCKFNALFSFFQTISIEGQDSLFGSDNCVASTQNSSQAQLPETDNKLDDSIDNQQQVRLISGSEKQDCRRSTHRDAV